jgi:hypothetical protein
MKEIISEDGKIFLYSQINFLTLGLHDVLIHSLPVSLSASRTLIIEPAHRHRSTNTTKSSSTIKPSPSANTLNSSVPNATMISETVPRQYRSTLHERTPSINIPNSTNQYLKAWHQQYNQGNHRQVQLNFLINKISLSLMDELDNVCLFREILRLTVDKISLLFYQRFIDIEPTLYQQQFFCSIDQLQIDNQCYSSKSNFDFPVVLMSKDEKRVSKTKTNLYEKNERHEYVLFNIKIGIDCIGKLSCSALLQTKPNSGFEFKTVSRGIFTRRTVEHPHPRSVSRSACT